MLFYFFSEFTTAVACLIDCKQLLVVRTFLKFSFCFDSNCAFKNVLPLNKNADY